MIVRKESVWKRIALWVGIPLLLIGVLVGAGIAYTWYVGNQEKPAAEDIVLDENPAPSLDTPPAPDKDAPIGASVQYVKSPVGAGENSTLSVRTTPTAECTPTVLYNEVPSADSGLKSKVADEYGVVSWTWTVDVSAPTGEWPVEITCVYEKRDAFVRGYITVE